MRIGEKLSLDGDPEAGLELHQNLGAGQYVLAVQPPLGAVELLGRVGQTPLPPYIRRKRGEDDKGDRHRYQTVYAFSPGAVAAPTAGLHFTPDLLAELDRRETRSVRVTLHVGAGTFLPVKANLVENHRMHSEWYDMPRATAEALRPRAAPETPNRRRRHHFRPRPGNPRPRRRREFALTATGPVRPGRRLD